MTLTVVKQTAGVEFNNAALICHGCEAPVAVGYVLDAPRKVYGRHPDDERFWMRLCSDCISYLAANTIGSVEEAFYSFTGRPFTRIVAEKLAITPSEPGYTDIDVSFAQGKHALKIVVGHDVIDRRFIHWAPQPLVDGSPPEEFGL